MYALQICPTIYELGVVTYRQNWTRSLYYCLFVGKTRGPAVTKSLDNIV